MNEIRALLKTVARRLELNSFIAQFHLAAIVVAGLALVLIVADRTTTAAGFVPWQWVGPAMVIVATMAALVMWYRRRPTEGHVAIVADERLDLREKLSTALHCQGRDDAFAQAAVEDAVHVARDPRTRELARRRFAVTAPPGWWVSPVLVLAAIMISFVTPRNLFERTPDEIVNVNQAKVEAEKSIEAVIKSIQEKRELSKELAMGELSPEGTDPNALRRPEDVRQSALKKLTDLNKKLDEIVSGEKGKTAEALEKTLSKLQAPEDGPARELAESLAKGDFANAQKALQEMMNKLQNGEMNEQEKQQLAEQLQNIAEQLEKLAQQQQQLQDALKQAGMDPNLANNPQALQQALQNNQNLNQQQKQQLQQMAQAQQAAAQMCQGLGQMCQGMAQAMQGGQMAQMGQAGQQMAQQLGQMEQLQQLLMQAQAAMAQCQGQCQGLGQGLNMAQAMQQWAKQNGNGMGNWGQGAGGNAPIAKTPTATKMEKANVNTVEGEVIAKTLFQGQQVRGESRAKLIKVAEAARQGYDEAQSEDQLPRIYQDAQIHYFGELEKITTTIIKEGESGSEADALQPEQPAPDAAGSSSDPKPSPSDE